MHVLEAALFANLVSKGQTQHLPEQWRPALDDPQPPSRPFRAAAIRALSAVCAVGVIVSVLTIVSASPLERPAVMAGYAGDEGRD